MRSEAASKEQCDESSNRQEPGESDPHANQQQLRPRTLPRIIQQTALGIAWAVLRPLLTMVVFTLVFGKLARLPSGNVPYPILVFAALLPWQLFASAFSEAGNSLVSNANMIAKVYFPRLIVPAGAIIVSCVDFLISLAILAALLAWYGVSPDWRILTLPLFVAIALAAALGAGLWTAALNVRYRDVRFVIPFAVQLGLYVSPVGFSSSVIPEAWRLLYCVNPMVGVSSCWRPSSIIVVRCGSRFAFPIVFPMNSG